MTPMQAIKSATSIAAAIIGVEAEVGSITPGRYADLIAVTDDPLSDISALESPIHVMKGGALVR